MKRLLVFLSVVCAALASDEGLQRALAQETPRSKSDTDDKQKGGKEDVGEGDVDGQEMSKVESLEAEYGLDISEMVFAAAKRVTTVAQAPQIITVITDEEIRQQGYRELYEVIGRVPGYLPQAHMYGASPSVITTGIYNGWLPLYDGLNLRDPYGGYSVMHSAATPLEMIRRIETTTGPGGVLWGANSFMGVVSMIPKTADDLQGVEAEAQIGSGPGRPDSYRFYVMGGQKFFDGKLKALLHVNYHNYRWHERELIHNKITDTVAPFPIGPQVYVPGESYLPKRTQLLATMGNAQYGPFTLGWRYVFYLKPYQTLSLGGAGVHHELGEQKLPGCTAPGPTCVDPDDTAATGIRSANRFVYLRYHDKFLNDRADISVMASYVQLWRDWEYYTHVPPSSIMPGGFNWADEFGGNRAALTYDTSWQLGEYNKLLVGGDFNYEFKTHDYEQVFLTYPSTIDMLPFNCPEGEPGCPLLSQYQSSRLMGGVYIDDQLTLGPVTLEGGVRLDKGWGERNGYDLIPLFSGGAVYTFYPGWHAKVNYAEGFRTANVHATDGTGLGIAYFANPNIRVEQSHSLMGQLVSDAFRDIGPIELLTFNVSASYIWVKDFITLKDARFVNSDDIGINTAQVVARLNLKKGHSFQIGYTFLHMLDEGRGALRGIPAQSVSMAMYLRLIGDYLGLSSNLLLMSSAEDPNRRPHIPSADAHIGHVTRDENGNLVPRAEPTLLARGSDLVFDKLPPAANLSVGLHSALLNRSLRLAVHFNNALDNAYYYPDPYYSMVAGHESMPNPAPRWSIFGSLTYRYGL